MRLLYQNFEVISKFKMESYSANSSDMLLFQNIMFDSSNLSQKLFSDEKIKIPLSTLEVTWESHDL